MQPSAWPATRADIIERVLHARGLRNARVIGGRMLTFGQEFMVSGAAPFDVIRCGADLTRALGTQVIVTQSGVKAVVRVI